MPQPLPTVVIVGRPNVGKSTLFNRITGQRRAIVGDEPGITRDRLHGVADYHGRHFELIDTGGIVVDDAEYIPSQILKQAQRSALPRRPHHSSGGRTQRDHRSGPRPGAHAAAPRQTRLAGRQQGRHAAPRGPGARLLFAGHPRHLPGIGRTRHRRGCPARACHRRIRCLAPGGNRCGNAGRIYQSRDHRSAQRGQIHPAEHADGRGPGHRIAHRRHHARFRRRDRHARRPALHVRRYGRHPAQRQDPA